MAYDRNRRRGRRKVCAFCVDKVEKIDYKDTAPVPALIISVSSPPPSNARDTSLFCPTPKAKLATA